MTTTEHFSNTLINWYLDNQRVLPWRQTNDPYLIWVSEIILQQTRVNQGLDYYNCFISRFPDIHSLAEATEEEVLKLWQGLGYYSRARNMHTTAKFLVKEFNGKFPDNPAELLKLKGIGKYTAAAIASIAFSKEAAVVDGNVKRFLARYFGVEKPIQSVEAETEISALANELIKGTDPGTFNQALMEFGALQCVPLNPDCHSCCFSKTCVAFKTNRINVLPVRISKPKPTERYFNYLVVRQKKGNDERLLIKLRNQKDIWRHLYDFPLVEDGKLLSIKELRKNDFFKSIFNGFEPGIIIPNDDYRHVLTHRIIYARFFSITFSEDSEINIPQQAFFTDDISLFPLPVLIRNFVEANKLLPSPKL